MIEQYQEQQTVLQREFEEKRSQMISQHQAQQLALQREFEEARAKYDAHRLQIIEQNQALRSSLDQEYQSAAASYEQRRAQMVSEFEQARTALENQRLQLVSEFEQAQEAIERQRLELEAQYKQARETYEALKKEMELIEERLDIDSYGFYQPLFNFDTSEKYKIEIERVRNQQKALIRSGGAATCAVNWRVGGSQKEGQRMIKQNMKVLLRAFNGECNATIAGVTWANVAKMEERIRKTHEDIKKMGASLEIAITSQYADLKLTELRLRHEYEEKRHNEREEQRAIREQMREEAKARMELERAELEAAREEARYQAALEKARAEAARLSGEKMGLMNEKIKILEEQLEQARKEKERVISQAQLTKSGYVYIISNIGSFGENVYKIGMTRRLDPTDRVAELGDASVPFPFDVHAMIYSENAPALEKAIHNHFANKRVNMINGRKEFFHVQLAEIEKFALESGLQIEFMKIAEAREFRETRALRQRNIALNGAQPLLGLGINYENTTSL